MNDCDFQPDKWEEYLKSKHKDSSDSEEEESEDEEGNDSKNGEKGKTKRQQKTKYQGIDFDDDIPLSKWKDALAR